MIDESKLTSKSEELVEQIVDSDNIDDIKDLTALFNLNQAKKNIVRQHKLSNLLDKITDEVDIRFTYSTHTFDNEMLLDYMKATQSAIDRTSKVLSDVPEVPVIQQNNQTNIFVEDKVSRESKQKVAQVVKMMLMQKGDSNEILQRDTQQNV